jgi:phosphoribosylformylglycinamidine synthase subunit PurQ / glutaminase
VKVGIIRFPGSNCDTDTERYFTTYGHIVTMIWYAETELHDVDLLVLPGGFAFGDRVYSKATDHYSINPGVLAVKSPIMSAVIEQANNGLPVLGICNGFQILIHAGLLPGKLVQNDSKQFFCDHMRCWFVSPFFGSRLYREQDYDIPVAHGYGKYIPSYNSRPFLLYRDNPNGSFEDIAGVCNEAGNVFGMMPHPERSPDRSAFMLALEKYCAR